MTDEPKQYLIAHIREALAEDGRLNELNIDVTVAAGRIFLNGEVATTKRREAIDTVLAERFPDYEISNEVSVTSLAPISEVEPLS
jgi:BON domain